MIYSYTNSVAKLSTFELRGLVELTANRIRKIRAEIIDILAQDQSPSIILLKNCISINIFNSTQIELYQY